MIIPMFKLKSEHMQSDETEDITLTSTIPAWVRYFHGLAYAGVLCSHDPTTGRVELDVFDMDRRAHDALKGVKNITLQYDPD